MAPRQLRSAQRASRAPALLLLLAAAWSAPTAWLPCGRLRSGAVALRATAEKSGLQGEAFKGKVSVTLGPYKAGAMRVVGVPRPDVKDEAVEAALQKRRTTTRKFERINFTGSGARLGLTVKVEMDAKWSAGHPEAGQPIKGTKMSGFELELKEDQPEPWRQFVKAIVEKGMGQMEQKTFAVSFPADYKKADFAGKTADFTVLVREIGEMRPIEPDTRPDEVQKGEIAAKLRQDAEEKASDLIDQQIREGLLKSSAVDTEAKTKSVSWAKFGPESERAMKWNFILEEIGRAEGLPFEKVLPFLRAEADVQYA